MSTQRTRAKSGSVIAACPRKSFAIARVEAVELAQQRRPFHQAVGPARAALVVVPGRFEHRRAAPARTARCVAIAASWVRHASSSRCAQLNASPTVRPTTSAPWLRRISASPLAQVGEQRRLLAVVEHHALVVVVADLEEAHRGLRDRQQAAFAARTPPSRPSVGVDHAGHVGARAVDRAVDHVARPVDAVVERAEVGLGEDRRPRGSP